jgi:hypothetical protein
MAILCQGNFKKQTENFVRFLPYRTENCLKKDQPCTHLLPGK